MANRFTNGRPTNFHARRPALLSAQMNVGVSTAYRRHGAIGRQFIFRPTCLAVRAVYGSVQ